MAERRGLGGVHRETYGPAGRDRHLRFPWQQPLQLSGENRAYRHPCFKTQSWARIGYEFSTPSFSGLRRRQAAGQIQRLPRQIQESAGEAVELEIYTDDPALAAVEEVEETLSDLCWAIP